MERTERDEAVAATAGLNAYLRISGVVANEALDQLTEILRTEQWRKLGFTRPRDYVTAEVDLSSIKFDPEQRRELGALLAREADMPQREIAGVLGVGKGTIGRDLAPDGAGEETEEAPEQEELAEPLASGAPSGAGEETEEAKPTQVAPVMLTLRTHTGDAVEYPQPKAKATFNQTPSEGISWAEWSWNPVTGCLHGCEYCYARDIANRFTDGFPAGFTPLFHHERLDAPANTTIPAAHRDDPAWRRVFVCSMADLYGRWVPDEWIKQVHESMLDSPDWEYLLLTKFPARYVGLDFPASAWLGTSVDEQKRVRIAEDAFRQVEGVKYKWLSLEPLREPLKFTDLSMFDWVVIGAQTETRQPTGVVPAFAPPFEWVARIRDQAKEAGCKVHMKPNLANGHPGMQLDNEYPEGA